jgi:hypothetical protein
MLSIHWCASVVGWSHLIRIARPAGSRRGSSAAGTQHPLNIGPLSRRIRIHRYRATATGVADVSGIDRRGTGARIQRRPSTSGRTVWPVAAVRRERAGGPARLGQAMATAQLRDRGRGGARISACPAARYTRATDAASGLVRRAGCFPAGATAVGIQRSIQRTGGLAIHRRGAPRSCAASVSGPWRGVRPPRSPRLR